MFIVEWLMRLPSAEGILVVDKTVTNAMSDKEANDEARAMWAMGRVREYPHPDGFQIVDQDGRIRSGPRFTPTEHVR